MMSGEEIGGNKMGAEGGRAGDDKEMDESRRWQSRR
jgi:hypothetical protein